MMRNVGSRKNSNPSYEKPFSQSSVATADAWTDMGREENGRGLTLATALRRVKSQ